ncbi:unnamed protein product [Cylindrotheca closterium]|uniref:Uncharacterized protein n=1 Tax=Cylindrotheca closterium TaxID=2856 RepID=A0AAD2CEY0_9STRA|nr:unnamed protein product [Cylindrotheca closterium]
MRGVQLSRHGFSGAQVRHGFDATQAPTPQAVKTGYFDMSNVFHDVIKGKDENGNDVYLIPCPAVMTNVKLQADWHYASEDEDLPDLATEQIEVCSLFKATERKEIHLGCTIMSSWKVVVQTPPFVMVSLCMDSVMLIKNLTCTLTWVAEFSTKKVF